MNLNLILDACVFYIDFPDHPLTVSTKTAVNFTKSSISTHSLGP